MPDRHFGDFIDSLYAERFGHPDQLAATLAELTDHVRQLDEIIAERYERLARLAEDQPELDDLELHTEARYQQEIIAANERRRAADMSWAMALRKRLEGEKPSATNA
jgi:formate dehydrogenase maturation protein FdhE